MAFLVSAALREEIEAPLNPDAWLGQYVMAHLNGYGPGPLDHWRSRFSVEELADLAVRSCLPPLPSGETLNWSHSVIGRLIQCRLLT